MPRASTREVMSASCGFAVATGLTSFPAGPATYFIAGEQEGNGGQDEIQDSCIWWTDTKLIVIGRLETAWRHITRT